MNADEQSPPALDDPRVIDALEQYLAAIEAGEKPNRRAFLARHADIAEALAECLDGLDALHPPGCSPTPLPRSGGEGSLFLPSPPLRGRGVGGEGASAAGDALELQPEAPLGDFRIVREIGRGGMGVVYEAVQLSLGRRVALKVLPFAAALDAKQLRRFQNEARAAAQLHHTNIVPVYSVGVERSVHFYAMQLIEGQNLAALVEDLRRDAAPVAADASQSQPSAGRTGPYPPPLPTAGAFATDTRSSLAMQLSTQRSERTSDFFRTVARLIAQAAEALDYAHGLGIVHRDVKPANLLVDDRENVWITDFGLAQFHTDAGLTQTGDLLGTLRYMSPEQAGGQRVLLDHRTDIYSLGATLYELLTLRPIFDGSDRQTLLRQILHEEPRPPASVDRSIPPELETIVLKAVSKVPSERYATARDLADDLRRFLRHEPILARRATLVQRGRKWLRRHPSVLVAGVVLLVLLTAGSSLSAWLIGSAYERERQRAAEAEQRFRLARSSVDEMIQVAEEELADNPHLQSLRKRLLEAALVYYQEFIEQRREDPDARAELAAIRDRVKKILGDLAALQGDSQRFLLKEPAVLEDLETSPEQEKRLTELSREMDERGMQTFRTFRNLPPEERRQHILEMARTNEADIAAILNPEQRTRLRQIALQCRGPMAFRDADLAATLKLTAEQREKIRTIEADMFFGKLDCSPHGRPPAEPGETFEQTQKSAVNKILTLLTDEQAKRWKAMTGKPYTGPIRMFPPGPFGRPEGRPPELRKNMKAGKKKP